MSKLSVIVPVYNEEPMLAQVIDTLMRSPCPLTREWIFVDDCSTDRSLSILEQKRRIFFLLISQPKNAGKGAAILRGIEMATGNFILIQDADFEYDPDDIPGLLTPLIQGKADVVYGSRFKRSSAQVHRTFHYFVNRFLTLSSNFCSGIYLTDMETCYKIFRADILKAMNLKSKRFGFEIEVTAYIAKIRVRIFELPISYFPRNRLQGKKINWKDGVAALFHLIRFNWLVSVKQAYPSGTDFAPAALRKR